MSLIMSLMSLINFEIWGKNIIIFETFEENLNFEQRIQFKRKISFMHLKNHNQETIKHQYTENQDWEANFRVLII